MMVFDPVIGGPERKISLLWGFLDRGKGDVCQGVLPYRTPDGSCHGKRPNGNHEVFVTP